MHWPIIIIVFSIVVPAPTINVSRLPIDQLYTGTTLILTCTFELNGAVDTEVRVSSIWRRGGEVLYSNNRTNISEVTLIQPSVFQTTISISPVSDTLDSGQYSCQSDITSDTFVLFSDSSQQMMLAIEGMKNMFHTNDRLIWY